MTIGCTRCGVQQEGEILSVPIVFKFPHKKGCGQGIGPLCIVPGSKVKKEAPKKDVDLVIKDESTFRGKYVEQVKQRISPKGKKIDEEPKESKPKVEKIKVFGKKD